MPLTLGLTGMDPATEATVQTAFTQAYAGMGSRFSLTSETDADYVVVDMDSMYGPMSWLRLHGAGKTVIGLMREGNLRIGAGRRSFLSQMRRP